MVIGSGRLMDHFMHFATTAIAPRPRRTVGDALKHFSQRLVAVFTAFAVQYAGALQKAYFSSPFKIAAFRPGNGDMPVPIGRTL